MDGRGLGLRLRLRLGLDKGQTHALPHVRSGGQEGRKEALQTDRC